MCVMILNYLDKKSMYIGLYKTPTKALSCLVLSCIPYMCHERDLVSEATEIFPMKDMNPGVIS